MAHTVSSDICTAIQSQGKKKNPLTWHSEDSTPWVNAIYAPAGSCAAEVLHEIGRIIGPLNNSELSLKVVDSREEMAKITKGLILVSNETHGKTGTYSTRYTQGAQQGLYYLMIGSKLPETRWKQAANEIVAMVNRGVCIWTIVDKKDGSVRECQSAYGAVPVAKVKKPRPSKGFHPKLKAESLG